MTVSIFYACDFVLHYVKKWINKVYIINKAYISTDSFMLSTHFEPPATYLYLILDYNYSIYVYYKAAFKMSYHIMF